MLLKGDDITSRDFAFWLQGYLEVSGVTNIGEEQVKTIRNHLNMVFKHEIDPTFGDQEKQAALNKIHTPGRVLPGGIARC